VLLVIRWVQRFFCLAGIKLCLDSLGLSRKQQEIYTEGLCHGCRHPAAGTTNSVEKLSGKSGRQFIIKVVLGSMCTETCTTVESATPGVWALCWSSYLKDALIKRCSWPP